MCQNDFLKALKAAGRPTGDLSLVCSILDEFCSRVQEYTNRKVECVRTPGFVTNLGQEYRVTLKARGGFEHLLLRAHVPATGFPAKLDLYGDDLVDCADEQGLRRELTKFAGRASTVDVINSLAS